jgi:hypothetical protein
VTSSITSIGAATGIITLLLCWRIWQAFRPKATLLDHPAIFLGLTFLSILMLRLPQITWNHEINVDESQMIAQAHRYLSHPVPWRDVDGTTGGPLDSWFLSAPMLLGAPASWATARAMLWAAQCATMIFVYLALRRFGSRGEAQLSLMPTVLFYAFVMDADAVHYSSETLPVLLMSVVVCLLCRAWFTGAFSNLALFATGFLTGCIPLAKLQATPMAGYLLMAGLAVAFFRYRKNCGPKLGLMLAGAALFPCVLLGIVAASGAAGDFWISYILGPSAYTRESYWFRARLIFAMFTAASSFRGYFISTAGCAILLAVTRCYVHKSRPGIQLVAPLVGVVGLGVIAVGCMVTAGKGYPHYLLLLIPAQALFFGVTLALGKALLLAPEENDPHLFPKPIHWFLAAFALVICLQAPKAPTYFTSMRDFIATRRPDRKSFVARRLSQVTRPGDTISVWGWMPSYYVESGLMPATRDAIGHFMIEASPYRDNYYRPRYLKDLEQSRPAVFIDAMADGVFQWSWTDWYDRTHESFPALRRFIDENYSLWLTVQMVPDKPVGVPIRVYLLRQRMAELDLRSQKLTISTDPLQAPE